MKEDVESKLIDLFNDFFNGQMSLLEKPGFLDALVKGDEKTLRSIAGYETATNYAKKAIEIMNNSVDL